MTNLTLHSESRALIKPEPRSPILIRAATLYDLVFIDMLMKQHSEMVGFAPMSELEEHITETKTALIAEDAQTRKAIGYCLYKDRYMKREDCGNVSQLNVAPHKHRGLVGAALVQAMFERLPYGVRLFCCWCAQDLQANHFWEALGFVPLAYRTGSRGKEHGGTRAGGTRMHIFWERRVREGDDYPYWYPSQTMGGRMGEARLVLPIEPGTHWSDAKPTVLPGPPTDKLNERKALESAEPKARRSGPRKPKAPVKALPMSVTNGLRFGPSTPEPEAVAEFKPSKPKRVKQKNDPQHVAAAREFRDRYLEQVNAEGGDRLLASGGSNGKYDVSRQLEAGSGGGGGSPTVIQSVPLLAAA